MPVDAASDEKNSSFHKSLYQKKTKKGGKCKKERKKENGP